MKQETKQGIIRWAIKSVFGLLIYGLGVFLSAGDWGWRGGWLYVGLTGANMLLTAGLLVARRPALIARRSRMGRGTPGWDKALAPLMAWGPLLISLLCGFLYRFAGANVPLWLQLLACALALGGSLFTIWAMLKNPFFEATVRIQTEEGHVVASGGPYGWVRHPGYLGALVYGLATPLVLGVWWGMVGAGLFLIVVVLRTAREDRFLLANLPGYAGFTRRTKYRLIPGIW